MKATGDIAAEKFERFVRLANADSYLVYKALTSLKNPTDKDVEEYIKTHSKYYGLSGVQNKIDAEALLRWLKDVQLKINNFALRQGHKENLLKKVPEIIETIQAIEKENLNVHTENADLHAKNILLERNTAAFVWSSIDTAPRDGTNILLWLPYMGGYPVTGYFFNGAWQLHNCLAFSIGFNPTHWCPIPDFLEGDEDGHVY